MTRKAAAVGFSQRVRLEWLEQTANLILAGNDTAAIKAVLQATLADKISVGGQTKGCNRNKVISIVCNAWVTPRKELIALRDKGLAFLSAHDSVSGCQHLSVAVHWGMVMAAYPFWAHVASQTGRLLRLQGNAAASQIQRRLREQYGERETVSRAARRVLRSYLDWGVLQDTGTKGVYSARTAVAIEDPRLIAWLVEASLHARANGSAPLKELIDSPSFFPFRIKSIHAASLVAASSRLEVFRHGLDADLIMLRRHTKKTEPH